MTAALDSLEEVVADTPGTLEFLMREDELLFVDNHKTLHARSPGARSGISVAGTMAPCWCSRTSSSCSPSG